MYYREPRNPGPRDSQLIEVATHMAGIAVERERDEKTLRESEERFRSLVQNSSDVIVVFNADRTVRYVSPSVERVLGYGHEELIGLAATDIFGGVHPDDAERLRVTIARARDNPGVTSPVEFRIRHADGSWRCLEAIANNLLDEPSVRGMVFNGRDVTERKVLEKRLAYRAFHDSLTDLPNRALFMNRLEHALARSKRRKAVVAVLFMDLDNFKVVNDYLGHAMGDQLLVKVAERISACLRVSDTAARLGGDEFTVLLEGVADEGEATRVAQRIMEELRAPFMLGNQEVFVTASMGISFGTSGNGLPEDLLRDADIAMYRAKNRGKAHYQVFDPNMDFYARERLGIEGDLRRTIERGEFRVYYQPEVLPQIGEIFGVEALVRWEHPENGLVLPDRFIRIAEETGLILPIGRWVLEEACRQAREWHDEHPADPPLLLSVNLSARQFQHPDIAQDIAQVLKETGLDPYRLNLEITESAVMEDAQSTIGT